MKRKLNYKNIRLSIVLLIALVVIVHDAIMLGTSIAQFSLCGFVTFVIAVTTVGAIYDYFDEYLEKKAFVTANNKCKK